MTLVVRPGFAYDTDASNYIDAVEAVDQADTPGIGVMETGVRYAINDFVIGCKNDGIWTAIKNSCILAGAKTLRGSYIDLKSCTKVLTDYSFDDGTYSGSNYTTGDYNRKTGLLGNGSTKYLDSNRPGNADLDTNSHISIYNITSAGSFYMGSNSSTAANQLANALVNFQNRAVSVPTGSTGFYGAERTGSVLTARASKTNATSTADQGLATSPSGNYTIFARNIITFTPPVSGFTNARLAFYSIGEALNLALLDARVTDLITAFGVAIP